MAHETQLLALLKARELEEQRALQHVAEVERVVEQRKLKQDALQKEMDGILARLRELSGRQRVEALQHQKIEEVLAATQFSKRLDRQLKSLEPQFRECTRDFEMAKERLNLAEQELTTARVEKKKVERFLEEKRRQEMINGSAIDEIVTDELSTDRRGK